jgi:hypothetical protein
MAPIVESIEISRRPEDVVSYVTDPSRLSEWQRASCLCDARATALPRSGVEARDHPPDRSPRGADDDGAHRAKSSQQLGSSRYRRSGQGDRQRHG